MTNKKQDDDLFEQYIDDNAVGGDAWMMSLADLLSLLLVFFLLIYSMTSVKSGEWKDIKQSVEKNFSMDNIIESKFSNVPLGIDKVDIKIGSDLGYLYTILTSKLKVKNKLARYVDIKNYGSDITITIYSKDIFIDDTTLLKKDGELLLFSIGEILQKISNKIDFVNYIYEDGFTTPKQQAVLSLNRSMLLLKELKTYGNESDFTLQGRYTKNSDNKGALKIIINNFVVEH